jgi:hypothetical protein
MKRRMLDFLNGIGIRRLASVSRQSTAIDLRRQAGRLLPCLALPCLALPCLALPCLAPPRPAPPYDGAAVSRLSANFKKSALFSISIALFHRPSTQTSAAALTHSPRASQSIVAKVEIANCCGERTLPIRKGSQRS